MKLTADSLATHLRERLLPAYLISGDEPLLGGEAADAVRARARAAGFSEREVHVVARAGDWEEVRGSARNLSLFGARRVFEIRMGARPGAAGNAALVALLEARDPDTLFLILTPRLDRAPRQRVVLVSELFGGVLAQPGPELGRPHQIREQNDGG